MNKRSSKFSVWMTILWLSGIFSFYIFELFERPESFNELGDFLAGVFAPVAFLWLIYGYFQNSEALQVQIDEMSDGVKQQRELVEQQKKQFMAQVKSQNPLLVTDNVSFEYICNEYNKSHLVILFNFNIKNLGQVANNFYIRDETNQALFFVEQIDSKEVELVELELFEEQLKFNKDNSRKISAIISFEFSNAYGFQSILHYSIDIELSSKEGEENKAYLYRVE